jgi:hypothetical protein
MRLRCAKHRSRSRHDVIGVDDVSEPLIKAWLLQSPQEQVALSLGPFAANIPNTRSTPDVRTYTNEAL